MLHGETSKIGFELCVMKHFQLCTFLTEGQFRPAPVPLGLGFVVASLL
jgi:hypothetical protein